MKDIKVNNNALTKMFISHIDELICIKYSSFNGLSGGRCNYQIDMKKDSEKEKREWILSFLNKYPIDKLIKENNECEIHDLDHWEINFIFENPSLNRSIRRYGITEYSSPYVTEFVCMLQKNQTHKDSYVPLWLREKFKEEKNKK